MVDSFNLNKKFFFLISNFQISFCTLLCLESGSWIRVLKPDPEKFENRTRIRIQAKKHRTLPDPDPKPWPLEPHLQVSITFILLTHDNDLKFAFGTFFLVHLALPLELCLRLLQFQPWRTLCSTEVFIIINKCSDNSIWTCEFPAFLGNYDRPTDQQTDMRSQLEALSAYSLRSHTVVCWLVGKSVCHVSLTGEKLYINVCSFSLNVRKIETDEKQVLYEAIGAQRANGHIGGIRT